MKPTDLYNGNSVPNSIHLDFGSGNSPRNPFLCHEIYTVDLYQSALDKYHFGIKQGDPLPFPDNYFATISAYDVLEHISRDVDGRNLFVFYMNELCRVLKHDGYAVFVFPSFPHRDAFSDPTHVNYITEDTLNYFLGENSTGSYAGITTVYKRHRNTKLRFWKNWVADPSISEFERLNLRRKISLAKRSFFRVINPGHRIWILQKLN
jgi:SAM-dependent methyltransferase